MSKNIFKKLVVTTAILCQVSGVSATSVFADSTKVSTPFSAKVQNPTIVRSTPNISLKAKQTAYNVLGDDIDHNSNIKFPAGTNAVAMKDWSDDQWASWAKQVSMPGYVPNANAQYEQVDLNDMTNEQYAKIQNYFGLLENSMLQQAGVAPGYVNAIGMKKFLSANLTKYNADNWSIWHEQGHDLAALAAGGAAAGTQSYGENWASAWDYGSGRSSLKMTMDNVYKMIYDMVKLMITDDADSGWGHTKNFLGVYSPDSQDLEWAVGADKNGELHFNYVINDWGTSIDTTGRTQPLEGGSENVTPTPAPTPITPSANWTVTNYLDVDYVNYVPGYGIAVYNTPGGDTTGQYLPHGSAWKVMQKATDANGDVYYNVGVNQWVNAKYMVSQTATSSSDTSGMLPTQGIAMIVYVPGYGVNLWKTPSTTGGYYPDRKMMDGTFWQVYGVENGFFNVGKDQWIDGRYLLIAFY